MLILSIGQFLTTLLLAATWDKAGIAFRLVGFVLLVAMTTYNIIVVSHLFTHTPWFNAPTLNAMASLLNSINIGQSVQAYQLLHVRNHHRFNNDRRGTDGETHDLSSTFRDGKEGEHATISRYAFLGAALKLVELGRTLLPVPGWWRLKEWERDLLALAPRSPVKRVKALQQIRFDRMAHFLALCLLVLISWKWALMCYLPAFYISLVLVNIQNYYEHFGALPESRYCNSVSYYGRIYNLLTFNDGYHQEHHLCPHQHWSRMERARAEFKEKLDKAGRVISPVPAILGFLDRHRTLQRRATWT